MNTTRWPVAAGGAALIGVVAWVGVGAIGQQIWRAAWVVPLAVCLHAVQLGLSAQAWRIVTGPSKPEFKTWWLVRWVREAVNSMLPVAQLGGNLVAIRMLAQAGVPLAQGSAGVVLDVAMEAASLAAFTMAGIGMLASIGVGQAWLPWLAAGAAGAAALGLGVAGLLLAQRLGAMRLVEAGFDRLARVLPGGKVGGLSGLHSEFARLLRHRPALWRGGSLHLLAWAIGCGETWLALAAMGQAPSWQAVLVIESLGMAIRNAGFMVPGALGVQEGGFVLVGGLFGIPADTAIALSMVKRARELAVGVPGLLAWQWSELRRPGTPA